MTKYRFSAANTGVFDNTVRYALGATVNAVQGANTRMYYLTTQPGSGNADDKPNHTSGEVVEADGFGWTYLANYDTTSWSTMESETDDFASDQWEVEIVPKTNDTTGVIEAFVIGDETVEFEENGTAPSATNFRRITFYDDGTKSYDHLGVMADAVWLDGGISIRQNYFRVVGLRISDGVNCVGLAYWGSHTTDNLVDRCFLHDGSGQAVDGERNGATQIANFYVQRCVMFSCVNGTWAHYTATHSLTSLHNTYDGHSARGGTWGEATPTGEAKNCVSVNCTTADYMQNSVTAADLFSEDTSGTSGDTSITPGDQFEAIGSNDYRVKSGADIEEACAARVTGYGGTLTTDIAGDAFHATTPSAGAYETEGGAPPSGPPAGGLALLGVGI